MNLRIASAAPLAFPQGPRRLWCFVLAVIAVHGLLLYPWRMDLRRGALVATVRAMEVRVVAAEVTPAESEPVAAPRPLVKTDARPSAAPDERNPSAAAPKPAVMTTPATAQAKVSVAGTPASSMSQQDASLPASTPPPEPLAKAQPRLPPAPEYQMAGRLDPGPRPLSDVMPVYPPEAGQLRGTVVLRLLIGADGKVDNVGVVRSSPEGVFEASAVEAFAAARFSPGAVLGVPVKSQLTIEVAFTPLQRSDVSSPKY